MNKIEFKIKGKEMVEREVRHYSNSGSRVVVPSSWKTVKIIRIK